MKLSTRFGLAGICALALLTLVHWLRALPDERSSPVYYMLGVLPNVLAAVAIPFVFMGIVADQKPDLTPSQIRLWFYSSVAISFTGLVGWEFIQRSSDRLIFDVNDLGATILGSIFSIAAFFLITPKPET